MNLQLLMNSELTPSVAEYAILKELRIKSQQAKIVYKNTMPDNIQRWYGNLPCFSNDILITYVVYPHMITNTNSYCIGYINPNQPSAEATVMLQADIGKHNYAVLYALVFIDSQYFDIMNDMLTTNHDYLHCLSLPRRRHCFVTFLMGKHKRTGKKSPVNMLYDDVIGIIYDFFMMKD